MPTHRGTPNDPAGGKDPQWREKVDPTGFPVRDGEDPWTAAEISEQIAELDAEVARQRETIAQTEDELFEMRESDEGAGRDPADVGSSNFERDHEMSLLDNAREMMDQASQALRMIRTGHYGSCESCSQPIGKGRLQVFPRATLCVSCKQREERR